MPLKVSTITLGERNPIGRRTLDNLDTADLVLLVGPNGSGKSSFLAPLKRTGTQGSVSVLDDGGTLTEFSSTNVQQSITFISSQDLMTRVRSLASAIALAADASRLRVETKALESCITGLQADQTSDTGPTAPPELIHLQEVYLTEDEACPPMPRTDAHYATLGKRAAEAVGLEEWPGFDPDPTVGKENEARLRPTLRSLAGLETIQRVMTTLDGLQVEDDAGPASKAASANRELQEARNEAAQCIDLQPSDSVDDAISRLDDAAATVRRLIDARDYLATCRRSALEYLKSPSNRPDTAPTCPVCSQSIDLDAVSQGLHMHLDSAAATDDTEGAALKQSFKRFRDLATSLRDKASTARTREEAANNALAVIRSELARVQQSLQPAAGWHGDVTSLANSLCERIASWVAEHGTVASPQGETTLGRIVDDARNGLESLRQQADALSNRLHADQTTFNELQALGRVLRARLKLNAFQHEVALDEAEARRGRTDRRERWLRVLREMKADRERQADTARDRVLADGSTRERFTRLMERFEDVDPWLAALSYDGRDDGGNAGCVSHGNDSVTDLSEGQTVLVNLAAALTVASVVIGKPEHRPGWIVLDEPTNGLDGKASTYVADYLGSLGTQDLPGQIFVATFDDAFAGRLKSKAIESGRRVRVITLDRFNRTTRELRMVGDECFPSSTHASSGH
jgi:ABC-type cobalamin/Fe3+-siderophores transport system ATPase subunit